MLLAKIAFRGTLTLLSGLHIGNSNDVVEIGGIDKTLVRRPDNGEPYIPGSSLKGKLRSLLEQTRGVAEVGGDQQINELFGFIKEVGSYLPSPSRLIVRDAYLLKQSARELENSQYTDFPYTEIKFENSIDRVQGSAGHPRKIERVPVGAEFGIEFVLNVRADDNQEEYIQLLKEAIQLLEADYLGGSGSRGYGQVKVDLDFESPTTLYQRAENDE